MSKSKMFKGMPDEMEHILEENVEVVKELILQLESLNAEDIISIEITNGRGTSKSRTKFSAKELSNNKDLLQFANYIRKNKEKDLSKGMSHLKELRKLED